MSPSRARRVLATQLARAAVYKRAGAEYDENANPYQEERERRIYENAYQQARAKYLYFDSLHNDMMEFYGGARG